MIMEKRRGGVIKNWHLIGGKIYGDLYEDSRFRNGEPVRTSVVLKIEVETKNTVYTLDPNSQLVDEKRFTGRPE